MIRALFSGVSGLTNHQVMMDVIGNNIANVNTFGFKGARVTFAEALSQQVSSPFSPYGRFAGVNPMQVGLGMKLSSIDNNFTQGNLQSTGIATDLALQGDGFFVISDGLSRYYTRSGAFQVDANGNLVAQGGKMFVQGRMADALGIVASGADVGNITLPFGQKEPAKETQNVDFFCNLNADSDALQEIWSADGAFETYAAVKSTDLTGGFTVAAGANDTMRIAVDGESAVEITLAAGTYADASAIAAAINNALTGTTLEGAVEAVVDPYPATGTEGVYIRTTEQGAGKTITITDGTTSVLTDLGIATGATADGIADEDTILNWISGIDLVDGDQVLITGTNSDGSSVDGTYVYNDDGIDAYDTVADLLEDINAAFAGSNAAINSDGKLVLTDNLPGASQTTINLNAGTNTTTGLSISFDEPSFLNTVAGRDYASHTTSINVYDSLGSAHLVEMTFTKAPEQNAWNWEVKVDGGLTNITSGGTGNITFNNNGSLASFASSDGGPMVFTPDGANTMTVNLDPGSAGSYDGITQFDSPSTTIAVSQDGYEMGNLENISIGIDGIISGSFSNGVVRNLAQIVVADFTNPMGLMKQGDNLFAESANSGQAVVGLAQTNFNTAINSGYLEMSNVDLSKEFTGLIIAQRGFQANARVIQTSDMVLSEINGLKR